MTVMGTLKNIVPAIATGLAVLWTPPCPQWGSVASTLKKKEYELAVQSFIAGMTGLKVDIPEGGHRGTSFDVFGTLNPVDFDHAPFPKVALWAKLGIEGIDAVGSFISNLFKDLKKG